MGCIEWHVTDKTKPMPQTRFRIVAIVVGDAPRLLSRLDLLEQVGVVPFFDTKQIVQVVILQHLDMRGVGT